MPFFHIEKNWQCQNKTMTTTRSTHGCGNLYVMTSNISLMMEENDAKFLGCQISLPEVGLPSLHKHYLVAGFWMSTLKPCYQKNISIADHNIRFKPPLLSNQCIQRHGINLTSIWMLIPIRDSIFQAVGVHGLVISKFFVHKNMVCDPVPTG